MSCRQGIAVVLVSMHSTQTLNAGDPSAQPIDKTDSSVKAFLLCYYFSHLESLILVPAGLFKNGFLVTPFDI